MSLSGFVGGVNLTNLVTERATLWDHMTVNSQLTFQGHLTFLKNVTVRDLVDGVSLPSLWDLHTELLRWVRVDTGNLLLISKDQCHAVKRLQWAYASKY